MPEQTDIKEAKKHRLWGEFESWAESEDVDCGEFSQPDDWWAWWECFVSGAIAQLKRDTALLYPED